jgi:hypothetical protein
MIWNKPNFLKSRREKRNDRIISFASTVLEFALAAKEYRDRKDMEELQRENIRLKNESMKKELEIKTEHTDKELVRLKNEHMERGITKLKDKIKNRELGIKTI